MNQVIRYSIFTLVIVVLWQVSYVVIDNAFIFPGLIEIFRYLIHALFDPGNLLVKSVKGSVMVLFDCMLLGIITVLFLLIFTTKFTIIKEFFMYLGSILNPVPTFALFPIFLIVIGYNKITLYALTIFCVSGFTLVQLIGNIDSAKNIWKDQVENLKFNTIQSLFYVYLPALLPSFVNVIRNMFNQLFRILFAVETFFGLLGGGFSLGGLMSQYSGSFKTTEVYAILVLVMLFGLIINILLELAYRKTKQRFKDAIRN